ncbi:MAG: hypothetical protein EXR87_07670 [Gammaproteobacteria bacterium]|nr:hypothetical protein [Gammaproteobacteria bacterium]
MRSSLAARISALMLQILGQSGWLRSELRSLDKAGQGHHRMRELCDQLDSLDSSIVWDLRDDLRDLSDRSAPQAARILDWLRADVEPLVNLVCRLDCECPGHPLVSVATIACGDIVGRFREVENALMPIPRLPHGRLAVPHSFNARAAELPHLC